MRLPVNLTLTVLFLPGIIGSPLPENDPKKLQDSFEPEQLSPNNSAPNFPPTSTMLAVTQQLSEQYTTTTSPSDITPASKHTDPNAEPKITEAHDNPEIPPSNSTVNPQSDSELDQLPNNASVPTVPPNLASAKPNSTPMSNQSATQNSESASEPDLKPSTPVQSDDKLDPEVSLENQTDAQLEPSKNTTPGTLEIERMVSTDKPNIEKMTESQNENLDINNILSTKDSPTYTALIETTPASKIATPSPTKVQEKPTKPIDTNDNLQDLQDYQAGKGVRFPLHFLSIHCNNNVCVISKEPQA